MPDYISLPHPPILVASSQYSRAIWWEIGDIRGMKRAQNSWKICAKKEANKKKGAIEHVTRHERRA